MDSERRAARDAAERRRRVEQAIADARIEGHVPSPEFLADCEAYIEGRMTLDEARARSAARALAAANGAAIKSQPHQYAVRGQKGRALVVKAHARGSASDSR